MEYTNEVLQKMEKRKGEYNTKFANYFWRYFEELGGKITSVRVDGKDKIMPVPNEAVSNAMFNRGDRLRDCCSLWVWDKYEKNKLLDLQRLNRCKNSRFCPNCKMLNVSKFIHEFRKQMPSLLNYDFYMLTTTIPSEDCNGVRLRDIISDLYRCFRMLNHKFSKPLFTPSGKVASGALQCRIVEIAGGVRVLEITYNPGNGFHPHLHSIVLVPKNSINDDDLIKNIPAKWSIKRKQIDMKSNCDVQFGKVWTMLWYGIDFRMYDSVEYDPAEVFLKINGEVTEFKCLEVDFTPLDDDGIYEVFKYTFKSSEVSSYDVFKSLVVALDGRRIRQGFGVLYNLKCDDDSDGEKQALQLEIAEEPEQILTDGFRKLLEDFADYKKISRYNPSKDIELLNSILQD